MIILSWILNPHALLGESHSSTCGPLLRTDFIGHDHAAGKSAVGTILVASICRHGPRALQCWFVAIRIVLSRQQMSR
ncbi:hypothetical protein DFH29DRAFT_921441 [Suillus ampliporus]|nr:hypothetical protein DFH29DRAFT_921441 [Suillus ampliporus]